MSLKRSQHGVLIIDHGASPGIGPEDVARFAALGHRVPLAPEGTVLELKTKSCACCGGCVVLNPDRTRERAHCRRCDQYICDGCAATENCINGDCIPVQELADILVGSDKPIPADRFSPLIPRRP